MRTEFYYRKSNAVKAAKKFASENGGVFGRGVTFDHRRRFDFVDDEVREKLCWSGEVAAILVVDEKSCKDLGAFAYWDFEL